MQDVTDLPFWKVMSHYGGPDVYYTEYFRVYSNSRLNGDILRSITENPTGKPVVAQMIGNDIPSLVRIAQELEHYPVAAVDLNLGCPAPVVYRKCAGGGLLRMPEMVDRILGELRAAIRGTFTVKTRIGFETPELFENFLEIFSRHRIDLLTVHGRTVKEMYWSEVHYDYIARAVERLECPVLANGNIYSAAKAQQVLDTTKARGLMIGRGAIRNPWMFEQIRQRLRGETLTYPTGREVLAYLHFLYQTVRPADARESAMVQKMKKYMNYVGVGVEPTGEFLHQIRRATTEKEFFAICSRFLDHDAPMSLDPFPLKLHEKDVMAGEQL
jgi:tRNA-dihydrouridine synthase